MKELRKRLKTAPYGRGSECCCKRLVPILSRDRRERFSTFFNTHTRARATLQYYRVEQARACATTFSINCKPQFPSSVRIDSG